MKIKSTDKKGSYFLDRFILNIWKSIFYKILSMINIGSLKITCVDGNIRYFGNYPENSEEIQINDTRFYKKVVLGGSMGLGEAYVEGFWSSSDLSNCLRILAANCSQFGNFQKGISFFKRIFNRFIHLLRINTRKNSLNNIRVHYDLSNEFYKTFLDSSMTYSSALYDGKPLSLEQAQDNKLNKIIDLSCIKEGDRVLEIGSGWGALAFKAHCIGTQIKTITLSKAQHQYVRELLVKNKVSDKFEVKIQDYRDESGIFDAVLSCEMIEAVGKEYLLGYFQKIKDVLKVNGRAVIQAITINDEDYSDYSNSCDWIQKYIFPGGHLPSMSAIKEHINCISDFKIIYTSSFGKDYAKTLACWKDRFEGSRDQVSALGFDVNFQRKWHYYFSYCIAGFENEMTNVHHIVIERTA